MDASQLIKAVAPIIGSALAGPFGSIAASFVAGKLGVNVKDVQDAISAGTLTPDQVAQVKLAEIDFKKFLADHEIKLEQLSVDDRKNARDMQVSTGSTVPAVLTYLITVGFFGILAFMMSEAYRSSEPLLVMLGSLGTAWMACVSYWFGSSISSKSKDATIARSLDR